MYAKSTLSAIISVILIILAGACTDNNTEFIKDSDDSGSEAPEETVAYDKRFPFPVWTDDTGLMHFEISFGDDGVYPSEEIVLGHIAGKGWEIDKCYTYDAHNTHAPNKGVYALNEYNAIPYIVGGDTAPRFFFKDKTSAVTYFRWWYIPDENGNLKDTDSHYSKKKQQYTYDARTGILDCDIMAWFHVIKSTDNELWLGRGENEEPYEYCFVRYVKVAPETIEDWNIKYSEP